MVAFNKIIVGDTLYDCHKTKMGNTTLSRMGCWTVKVVEIDSVKERIFASWNGNPPKWMGHRQIKALRRTPIKSSA